MKYSRPKSEAMQELFPLRHDGRHNRNASRASRSKRLSERPKYFFDFSSEKGFLRRVSGGWRIPSFEVQPIVWNPAGLAALAQRALRPVEIDWFGVALAIYSADRFAPRHPAGPNGPTFWRRRIEVTLPVKDPATWKSATASLTTALEFLTEDDWTLQFVERSFRYAQEDQQQFEPMETRGFSRVALFSGGLDSTAGALQQLSEHIEPCLLVSGSTHARLHEAQERLIGLLQATFSHRVKWLPVPYGFQLIAESHGMESSQRCRGWVHVGLGLLAASLSGVDEVSVFENGTGAFNLPCEISQFGSQNSRAIHPVFLNRIATVASDLLGKKLHVRNPFIFDTKGGTLLHSAVAAHPHVIAESFSCEFFPNYYSRQRQCGVCPSCLIRRAGLLAAGLPDDGASYSWDVLRQGVPPSAKRIIGLIKLERFTRQIRRILGKGDSWDAFLIDYPEYALLQDECASNLGVHNEEFQIRLLRLQRNFTSEWQAFAERISGLRHSTHSLAA
jgi:7-cyano-7-deazaguanine synthase in queuosine biosynthesis